MSFATPLYSKGRINSAGDILVSTEASVAALGTLLDFHERMEEENLLWEAYNDALIVIDNWRSSHGYPLLVFRMTLNNRAKKVDASALVAQRIKRLSSIKGKLERFASMKLARMQDLGGCRAILRNVNHVDRLVAFYEKVPTKNAEFVGKHDYIACPKPDGYRSIHLVYKYQTNSQLRSVYNSLRVEMQFRSRLQHAWATAVETVSTFTGQALKASLGDENWKRFFCLMGSVIAIREKRPLVAGTPADQIELVKELRALSTELDAERVLNAWGLTVHKLVPQHVGKVIFLLELNLEQGYIRVSGFTKRESLEASEAYLIIEKEIAGNPRRQAVLVSVSSLQALRSAYPNYFADTQQFVRVLNEAIQR